MFLPNSLALAVKQVGRVSELFVVTNDYQNQLNMFCFVKSCRYTLYSVAFCNSNSLFSAGIPSWLDLAIKGGGNDASC